MYIVHVQHKPKKTNEDNKRERTIDCPFAIVWALGCRLWIWITHYTYISYDAREGIKYNDYYYRWVEESTTIESNRIESLSWLIFILFLYFRCFLHVFDRNPFHFGPENVGFYGCRISEHWFFKWQNVRLEMFATPNGFVLFGFVFHWTGFDWIVIIICCSMQWWIVSKRRRSFKIYK